jgi:hypothetical protein
MPPPLLLLPLLPLPLLLLPVLVLDLHWKRRWFHWTCPWHSVRSESPQRWELLLLLTVPALALVLLLRLTLLLPRGLMMRAAVAMQRRRMLRGPMEGRRRWRRREQAGPLPTLCPKAIGIRG